MAADFGLRAAHERRSGNWSTRSVCRSAETSAPAEEGTNVLRPHRGGAARREAARRHTASSSRASGR